MFKVFVADPISDHGIQKLTEAEDVTVIKKTGLTEDELIVELADADALLVRSQTKVTPRIMEAAKKLKVIGRAGVGVDNIDLEAATQHGIIVINAPDGNTISTCEHTFAMMISLARNIPQAYKKTVEGHWDRKTFVGVELRNKVLGIIGLGRIGSEVAKRAKVFGMEVIGYDPFMTEERADKLGIQLLTVNEIVAKSDFITVHTPLTKETRHIISTPQFELMKDGVRIINCARGGIVDEQALLDAVEAGKVSGAAFDVFEEEPPSPDHPFLHHPKIIVTPHLGASTQEAQENVAIDVSEEVLHILRDQPFKNAVNMPPVSQNDLKKIQPYFQLGEKMGLLLIQLASEPIHEIEINFSGELSEVDTAPLVRQMVKGLLSYHFGSEVNIVNALHHAKAREINIIRTKSSTTKGFTNLIRLTVRTSKGSEHMVAGTLLNGYGARIVEIDKYSVDLAPEGHVLLVSHVDRPGIIGKLGSILGDHGTNIATMQVARKSVGGDAVMLLSIDKPAEQSAIEKLSQVEDIKNVQSISL